MSATRQLAADPAAVWPWLAEPERHVRTLPGAIVDRSVSAEGHVLGTLTAMGANERVEMALEAAEPGRRLVARRVGGDRRAVTTFLLSADGSGTRVDVDADVDLPFLLAAIARAPLEQGLAEQLEHVDRLSAGEA